MRQLNFINGVRALAALFVVLGHAYYQPGNGYYQSQWITHLGLSYGHLAVVVFIVVSGFCLGLPAAERGDSLGDLRKFFYRRFKRIFPPYLAALLISVVLILTVAGKLTGTVWDNSLPFSANTFICHLLMVHNLPVVWQNAVTGVIGLTPTDHPGALNYPLWSIAVEFQLYLLMPLMMIAIRRFGIRLATILCVLVGLALHNWRNGFLDCMTPWYLGQFALGIAAARYATAGSSWRNSTAASRVLIGAVFLLLVGIGKARYERFEPYIDTLVALATALGLCGAFAAEMSGNVVWTANRHLVNIGVFSYSLYLVHAPILHLLDQAFVSLLSPGPVMRFMLLVVSIPIVVFGAWLFHVLFERPFLPQKAVNA